MVPDRLHLHQRIAAGFPPGARPSFDELVRRALATGLDVHDAHVWLTWAERQGLLVADGDDERGRRRYLLRPPLREAA